MPPLNQFFKMAVMAGVESAVQLHIDRGDDLNARDSSGLTLLMLSAAKNKAAMCQLLLNAGADGALLDPAGRTAHAIAIAAGAQQAVEVLGLPSAIPQPSTIPEPAQVQTRADAPFLHAECAGVAESAFDVTSAEESLQTPVAAPMPQLILENDEDGFSLFDWEPEEELLPPELDPTLVAEASAVQAAISAHEPIDSSADWDDVDAFLPDQSVPFIRKDDVEARERLRLLLLRAYREGSVPSMEVESLSTNADGSTNPEFEALLTLLLNDLGAEIDERFEYASSNEDFTVFVSPQESEDEEELIDNAMQFVDSAASRRAEPLRTYLRDFQKIKLISGEEEVVLAQRMEQQHNRALDALGLWPHGIEEVLAAGRLVQAKKQTLFSMSMGPIEAQPELDDTDDEPVIVAAADSSGDESDEEAEESAVTSDNAASLFFDALLRLSESVINPQLANSTHEIREHLDSLRLNTSFLFGLAKAAATDTHESANAFLVAMTGYLQAREQMASANLKLAFHIAKKYLYSGEPLDDLAQEANIGLMKAVERFDWRRGYKFSTYATWWIRQQVSRAVADTVRTIRIPVHVHEKLQRLSKEMRAFESETGRPPEPAEIAERLGISLRILRTLERISQEPTFIDDEFDDELIDASAYSSLVSPDPFESCAESQFCRTVDSVILALKLKEEKVIRLRFGIGVNSSFTLEEVGVAYGVTRERIRQVEAKSLRKLRSPIHSDRLLLAFSGCLPVRGRKPLSVDVPAEADEAAGDIRINAEPINDLEAPPSVESARPDAFIQLPATSKSLGRLLSQMEGSGIRVLDDRQGESGKIWVDVADTSDGQYRKLVRKLLAVGFEFSPGKGYWK
ncbi:MULTISPECIES: sigma-70 family RNA polymerase sigma factor [unclassified Duganella]|uniref:sigma-70 family RNA polymerase sigma factor n=1 Tax=unclassified Duganella TaxID=2636909 RepID=UPI00088246D0|nr:MULTISPECIES: sigma-70 family RNA polymerase sigma factor [unclassified Duganella]SDH48886.1 RNA polymerase primary sigma factor [Duganella sp. OV458]SDK64414.1 RNA polymerase primary sigma factor [Duganella sp. OV510]